MTREREIERYFVDAVLKRGGMTDKFTSLTRRGVADRIAYFPDGSVWFVEIKTIGGRLSALQQIYARERRSMKQNYACLWTKDQVDEWIRNLP